MEYRRVCVAPTLQCFMYSFIRFGLQSVLRIEGKKGACECKRNKKKKTIITSSCTTFHALNQYWDIKEKRKK